MNTSADFFTKSEYSQQDLNALIFNKAEESLYLEFKASGSLQTSDQKKNEIAKDISAFANSDGGILIYGINEVNHIADSYSYIEGTQFTKEWLENIIQSRINRRLPVLEIHPVRIDGDIAKTIYLVKIGRSQHAPHMTAEKKYYRRLNFQAVQMEEYEVRDTYNRLNKTELTFADLLFLGEGNATQAGQLSEVRYGVRFQIQNIGTTVEQQFKIEIHLPIALQGVNQAMSLFKIRAENGLDVYSIPNTSPLFQEETTTLGHFHIVVARHLLDLLDKPIRAKLYYSGGVITTEFTLKDKLFYEDKPLYTQF